MSKHTPGPWRVLRMVEPIGYAEFQVAWSDDGELVCDVVYEEADARLIAFAPELLVALKNMVSLASPYFTDGPQRVAISEARAAIAKAEGE